MSHPRTKSLLFSLVIGLVLTAGCGGGKGTTPQLPPEILSISWGSDALLPGQTRTLVAETSGEVSNYEWTLSGDAAILVQATDHTAKVATRRSGAVQVELQITGPSGQDDALVTLQVAEPQASNFTSLAEVPFLVNSEGAFGQEHGGPSIVVANGRIWILYTSFFVPDPLPRNHAVLASVPVGEYNTASSWQSTIFSENLGEGRALFILGGQVYAIYKGRNQAGTTEIILALAQSNPHPQEEDFRKLSLASVPPSVPGDRFQVRESGLLILHSRTVSPPFNKAVLGRISLTPTVTSADYVEGDLPGSTGPFWDPQMLPLDDGIAIAWGYDRNQYMVVQSVFPPWDTYNRGDLPMSSTATQVTGLGPWGDSGIVMGFWDQGTGRQFVTTSPTVTPTLNDWTTPVEVQQAPLGNPVMWGGRQVWHTSSNPAFPGQLSLARTIAAPPTSLDDLVFAPMIIDNIGRSEIPNMVEIDGRLVIAHPYDPDGSGPEPARIRLLRSDGPW